MRSRLNFLFIVDACFGGLPVVRWWFAGGLLVMREWFAGDTRVVRAGEGRGGWIQRVLHAVPEIITRCTHPPRLVWLGMLTSEIFSRSNLASEATQVAADGMGDWLLTISGTA